MSFVDFKKAVRNLTITVDATVQFPTYNFWALRIRDECRKVLEADLEDLGFQTLELLELSRVPGNTPAEVAAFEEIEKEIMRFGSRDLDSMRMLECQEHYIICAKEALEDALYLDSCSPFGNGCPYAWEYYESLKYHADALS